MAPWPQGFFFIENNKTTTCSMNILFIGTTEIIVIVLVVLLLFGGKKIPELMQGMGKGVKSFKDGMNGIESPTRNDKDQDEKK